MYKFTYLLFAGPLQRFFTQIHKKGGSRTFFVMGHGGQALTVIAIIIVIAISDRASVTLS